MAHVRTCQVHTTAQLLNHSAEGHSSQMTSYGCQAPRHGRSALEHQHVVLAKKETYLFPAMQYCQLHNTCSLVNAPTQPQAHGTDKHMALGRPAINNNRWVLHNTAGRHESQVVGTDELKTCYQHDYLVVCAVPEGGSMRYTLCRHTYSTRVYVR